MKNQKLLFILFIAVLPFLISSCKEGGCTDEQALNFNIDAGKDDGSCIFPSDKLVGNWEVTEVVDGNTSNPAVYTATISKSNNTSINIEDTRSSPPAYSINGQFDPTVNWEDKTLGVTGTTISGEITDEDYFVIDYVWGTPTAVYTVNQEYRRQ